MAQGELGEYERAMQDLGTAIQLDPKHISAYVNRGVVYYQTQEFDLALADF